MYEKDDQTQHCNDIQAAKFIHPFVYNHDGKPYLASGAGDESIQICDLKDRTLMPTLEEGNSKSLTYSIMAAFYDRRSIMFVLILKI